MLSPCGHKRKASGSEIDQSAGETRPEAQAKHCDWDDSTILTRLGVHLADVRLRTRVLFMIESGAVGTLIDTGSDSADVLPIYSA